MHPFHYKYHKINNLLFHRVNVYFYIGGVQRTKWKVYISYAQLKKEPTAQIAHLVFADTKANAEKTKRAIFCQRSDKMKKLISEMQKLKNAVTTEKIK